MEFITYILFITILFIIIYLKKIYFIEQIHSNILDLKLKGPKAYPVIGNAYMFTGTLKDITSMMLRGSKLYKSPWRLWIGSELIIVLDDPKNIKTVLGSSYALEKSALYTFFKPALGNGLLTAPVIEWKSNRKQLRQIFKNQMIENYLGTVVTNSLALLEKLDSFKEEEIDILPSLCLCTLDVICDALLGVKFNLQNDPKCEIDKHIARAGELVVERGAKLWLYPDFIYYNTSKGKEFSRCLSAINNFTQQVIEKGKELILKHELEDGVKKFGNAGENKEKLLNILFNLSKDKEDGSEKYIQDEIFTFVAAGSETTAATMSFTLLMLATYPEIQEKVYNELFQMYGSNDPQDFPIRHVDIKNMKYLEQVIKETLRIFPAVPLIGRQMSDSIKVNDGVVIPKNSSVICLIIALHRNVNYWKEPLQFDPDRFLSGNYNTDNFIPFSIGRRDCIGKNMAMLEMKIILANIFRKFIVKIDHPRKIQDIDVKISIPLKPSKPILLRFIRR